MPNHVITPILRLRSVLRPFAGAEGRSMIVTKTEPLPIERGAATSGRGTRTISDGVGRGPPFPRPRRVGLLPEPLFTPGNRGERSRPEHPVERAAELRAKSVRRKCAP
jgi:hypothetical protein